MRVKIKTVNGSLGLPNNLQLDKIYLATRLSEDRMKVVCDDGQEIITSITKSGYLGEFGEWEIVDEVPA
ncbi:hypothetical protein N0P26_003507 [Acinetobacter baumannii]|uniref:Uncharacterized protein n=1 Tax=Acinetobacter baumannii TaxID=470 RepID=A0A9P2L7S5_ACIBA|nr:hypothetical protein [Acinetobacter baumannii]EKT7961225.1 hypothetical protein [Acinetobacter baumannii]EKT9125790.1 hypothetical protein [Acinetobacter baumannii]EKT9272676.1 hypothetical protein [Acinetobacter baumannii]EKT9314724.1 hypothetical protein [Acinetobacter baumannii]EKU0110710.1 hypothetical protein [Acinetobacter baumannii]